MYIDVVTKQDIEKYTRMPSGIVVQPYVFLAYQLHHSIHSES